MAGDGLRMIAWAGGVLIAEVIDSCRHNKEIAMRIYLGLTLLFACFAATPASAQGTAGQRAACTDDAYRFCENVIRDEVAVEKCLRENFRGLSRACRSQFAGGKATKKRRR